MTVHSTSAAIVRQRQRRRNCAAIEKFAVGSGAIKRRMMARAGAVR
jgi:hypothetical protein